MKGKKSLPTYFDVSNGLWFPLLRFRFWFCMPFDYDLRPSIPICYCANKHFERTDLTCTFSLVLITNHLWLSTFFLLVNNMGKMQKSPISNRINLKNQATPSKIYTDCVKEIHLISHTSSLIMDERYKNVTFHIFIPSMAFSYFHSFILFYV